MTFTTQVKGRSITGGLPQGFPTDHRNGAGIGTAFSRSNLSFILEVEEDAQGGGTAKKANERAVFQNMGGMKPPKPARETETDIRPEGTDMEPTRNQRGTNRRLSGRIEDFSLCRIKFI